MNQNMHMIRHHTPGEQFVAFVMKMKHRVFGNCGDARIAQMTFADATIKILLQLRSLLAVIFNLQQMFPLAAT